MAHDVVIIGAGAAGLMCAVEAGKRGRRAYIIDHAEAPGEKIRISGGGRCNFTNLHSNPTHFLSQNPHFCVSALSRYTPQDFIRLVEKHGIAWHEKKLGQLFCDGSSRQIVTLLTDECREAGVELRLGRSVHDIAQAGDGFALTLDDGQTLACASLVIATGGPSIPKMGATGWGYEVARHFGLALVPTRPALVPFTLDEAMLGWSKPLSGVALDARASCGEGAFDEAILFTHRGLSGPAVLQISSYWKDGDEVRFDLMPGIDLHDIVRVRRTGQPRQELGTLLAEHLPKRLVPHFCGQHETQRLADLSNATLNDLSERLHRWRLIPNGTEGYRTAEVTLGGVDTGGLSSKTMESKAVPGLYFIGEVVDVTGHLGGHNFQWAWASGHAAGRAV